jgi:hypothetical protein
MFADICESTFLFNQLGDEKAARLVNQALHKASESVQRNGGKVLRTKGDDILCIFSKPLEALQASREIHSGASRFSAVHSQALAMSIGINSGPALLSEGDILGDTVNMAARLSAFAKAGQTLVSSQTVDLLGPVPPSQIRPFGEITLKGKSESLSTFEVLDDEDPDEITQVGPTPLQFPKSNWLSLKYQSKLSKLDYRLVRFLIGRNSDCELVIEHPLISRHHAEIRYQNNEFVLTDFSTNGTELIIEGRPTTLHHNSLALHGNGSIFPGRMVYNQKFEIAFHDSGGSRRFNQTHR